MGVITRGLHPKDGVRVTMGVQVKEGLSVIAIQNNYTMNAHVLNDRTIVKLNTKEIRSIEELPYGLRVVVTNVLQNRADLFIYGNEKRAENAITKRK